MTRTAAIQTAEAYFDNREFHADLARRVAMPTESQNPDRAAVLQSYLADEMSASLHALGFASRVYDSPVGKTPFLIATRIEADHLPTVMSYGHGDVIRGLEPQWHALRCAVYSSRPAQLDPATDSLTLIE